jgi:hypothetical protein
MSREDIFQRISIFHNWTLISLQVGPLKYVMCMMVADTELITNLPNCQGYRANFRNFVDPA